MIILKNDGNIAKFFNRYDLPPPTNLCQIFWKTLLFGGIFTAVGVLVGLYIMGVLFWFVAPWHFLAPFAAVVTFAVVLIGLIVWGCNYLDRHKYDVKVTPQWRMNLREAYTGWKEKYCPLVEYKDD